MDLKSTIGIILKDLEEARNILDDLKNYPDIPSIQIELAKAKCRSAEEVLRFIADKDIAIEAKAPSSGTTEPEIPVQEREEDKAKEAVSEIAAGDIASGEENTETVEESDIEAETVEEDIIDQIIQPEGIKDEITEKADTESRKIIADKFSRESSINERIASSRNGKEGSEVNKLKPVTDLTAAIGLNDRFQYVRELFNGDQELYSQTLSKLNDAMNIDDAFNILSEASRGGRDSESFDQLISLVKRKLLTK